MRNFFLKLTMISLLLNCNITANSSFQDINSDELETFIDKKYVKLIDVRTPNEYNSGHIKNAINIDYYGEEFDLKLNKLDKSKPIVFYCKSGGRSSKSALKLIQNGFKEIYNLEGGIDKWISNGKEILD